MTKRKSRGMEAPAVKKKKQDGCSEGRWCAPLLRAIDDVRIRSQPIVRLTTGKHVIAMAVLYSGEYKQKGAFLNFCPFCGHSFGKDYKAASKRADQEEARAKKKAAKK